MTGHKGAPPGLAFENEEKLVAPIKKLSLGVFLTLGAMCLVHSLHYYPQLPDIVATHFGFDGRPDAWSDKQSFFRVYLLALALCVGVFPGIAFGASRLPLSMISLPNKSHWLAPERRQATFDFFFQYFLWFGSATVLLHFDVMHQAFQVHLGRAEALQHPMLSLVLYLGFTALWCVGLFLRFSKK